MLAHSASLAAADNALTQTRTALEQWVKTRQLTAQTRTDWASEKEMLEASIQLFEKELKDLDGRYERIGTNSVQISKEKAELEQEQAKLEAASAKAALLVTDFEKQVKELSPALPDGLRADLTPLIDKIPADPTQTRLSAAQRMQNVVGILNEIEKFNSAISVQSEIRKNAEGLEVQVETLYLGLSQAYYVGQEGRFAGVSRPSPQGWQLQQQNELGPAIARAISVFRNQTPASFVTLPLTIE